MASCCLQEVQRSRERDGETGKHVVIVTRWSDISLERWKNRMYLELSLVEKKSKQIGCKQYLLPPKGIFTASSLQLLFT